MNRCGCKSKKYIDQIWSHKEYRVLCTRLDREGGTRVEQFFSTLQELHLESFLFTGSIETVSSLLCDCQIQGKSKDGKFDNKNYFRHKIDVKVKT